jgi:hypothetical protein
MPKINEEREMIFGTISLDVAIVSSTYGSFPSSLYSLSAINPSTHQPDFYL